MLMNLQKEFGDNTELGVQVGELVGVVWDPCTLDSWTLANGKLVS